MIVCKKIQVGLFLLAALAIPVSEAAEVSSAIFMQQGDYTAMPVPVSKVSVFAGKPDYAYRVLGAIEATGMAESTPGTLFELPKRATERDDYDLALKALKYEAAERGADAVVIIKNYQMPYETGTARRLYGIAIQRLQ